MSIRPINFNPDGSIDVHFDELGHMGNILANEVRWATDPITGDNHNYIILACPDGCGSTSTWPVGGGADAPMGQEMFVRKVDLEGCACGQVPARSSQDAIDHVKELVTAMDGEERWQLDDAAVLEHLTTA
jgi:hypothetical protein